MRPSAGLVSTKSISPPELQIERAYGEYAELAATKGPKMICGEFGKFRGVSRMQAT